MYLSVVTDAWRDKLQQLTADEIKKIKRVNSADKNRPNYLPNVKKKYSN